MSIWPSIKPSFRNVSKELRPSLDEIEGGFAWIQLVLYLWNQFGIIILESDIVLISYYLNVIANKRMNFSNISQIRIHQIIVKSSLFISTRNLFGALMVKWIQSTGLITFTTQLQPTHCPAQWSNIISKTVQHDNIQRWGQWWLQNSHHQTNPWCPNVGSYHLLIWRGEI